MLKLLSEFSPAAIASNQYSFFFFPVNQTLNVAFNVHVSCIAKLRHVSSGQKKIKCLMPMSMFIAMGSVVGFP